jgi:hypothetical protein
VREPTSSPPRRLRPQFRRPTSPAIRAWLKYGITLAQVADACRVPITEIKRLLGES